MLNSPASLSLRMLRAVLSRMASIREDTSGSLEDKENEEEEGKRGGGEVYGIALIFRGSKFSRIAGFFNFVEIIS